MKYELVKDSSRKDGTVELFRVKALHDFDTLWSSIKAGELGGYVEGEKNLSQEGRCWVYPNARVLGHAEVSENAIVGSPDGGEVVNVNVYAHSKVNGNACVFDGSICTNAVITGNAEVRSCELIGGSVVVCDDVIINNNRVRLAGKGLVGGDVSIFDEVRWDGFGKVYSEEDIITLSNIPVMQVYLMNGVATTTVHFNKRDGILFGRFLRSPLMLDDLKKWANDKSVDDYINKGVHERDAAILKAMHELLSAIHEKISFMDAQQKSDAQ